ncbi:VOC family protein [Shouchella patagoniensis]|uniref:VOC family protein n=1 Tax=Shouchella patagoniensis TaxID=228576 RepID=UPI000995AA2F|nr:VOC family protein [Shouchella patagoniensis]
MDSTKMTMGEVTLIVTNIKRSIRFYKEVIGFSYIEVMPQKAKLFNGKGELLLVLEENDQAIPVKANQHSGLYHFALLLPDRKSLANQFAHLINKQIRLGGADHAVSEAIYLNDPDGNGIELYRDRPRVEWTYTESGDVVMDTKALDVNGLQALAEDWKGLPEGTCMGHVHMHVVNLSETEQFYNELLDFQTMARYGPQALFMAVGGYHHHLGFNTWSGEGATPQPQPAAGMKQYKIWVTDSQTYNVMYHRIKDKNLIIEEESGCFKVKDPSSMAIVIAKTNECN